MVNKMINDGEFNDKWIKIMVNKMMNYGELKDKWEWIKG